jgi:hypothetical protein
VAARDLDVPVTAQINSIVSLIIETPFLF